MRLAVDREPGDVEPPHQRWLIDERVVLGRGEHHRVGRLVEAASDFPTARRHQTALRSAAIDDPRAAGRAACQ